MKFCDITIPDNPLEEITKSWNDHHHHNQEFSIQKLWNEPPINWGDVPTAKNSRKAKLWKREYPLTGCFVYPPGGGMGWHTNSDNAGVRIYLSWSENGDSGMGWLNEDGTVRLDYDSPGWNVRVFNVPEWHCVFSNCWRCSLGMKP